MPVPIREAVMGMLRFAHPTLKSVPFAARVSVTDFWKIGMNSEF